MISQLVAQVSDGLNAALVPLMGDIRTTFGSRPLAVVMSYWQGAGSDFFDDAHQQDLLYKSCTHIFPCARLTHPDTACQWTLWGQHWINELHVCDTDTPFTMHLPVPVSWRHWITTRKQMGTYHSERKERVSTDEDEGDWQDEQDELPWEDRRPYRTRPRVNTMTVATLTVGPTEVIVPGPRPHLRDKSILRRHGDTW